MKCPVCTTVNLVMSERQGVEIDYCPDCRGVWLDRGELDKIIQRAAQQEAPTAPPQQAAQPQQAPQPQQYAPQPTYGNGHAPGYGHGQNHGQKPYRKKSFLEELFD
ncbi:MAG: hypothetical protein A2075_07425 [Geobacteraceae bacterium GWC2_58_44]|nr:MAG: hypothetical protein A2075_07425 [Geobacteraceae bacterium GWC2_58_44]HBG07439.1 hypothetical protein [Geobacter sp.]